MTRFLRLALAIHSVFGLFLSPMLATHAREHSVRGSSSVIHDASASDTREKDDEDISKGECDPSWVIADLEHQRCEQIPYHQAVVNESSEEYTYTKTKVAELSKVRDGCKSNGGVCDGEDKSSRTVESITEDLNHATAELSDIDDELHANNKNLREAYEMGKLIFRCLSPAGATDSFSEGDYASLRHCPLGYYNDNTITAEK